MIDRIDIGYFRVRKRARFVIGGCNEEINGSSFQFRIVGLRSQTIENLILATGHGMLGVSLSPITGKLVSQIVTGEAPAIDLYPFRPERF